MHSYHVHHIYLSDKHLIDEYSQAPPVHSTGVGDVRQHLGREELWCATERTGPCTVPHALLAQTKIGNLDKTVYVEQKVV